MKILPIAVLLCLLCRVSGAEPVSLEAFAKITDPIRRDEIIQHAPAEQKEELQKIDYHMRVVAKVGGEDQVQSAKEGLLIIRRGLSGLGNVFYNQEEVWQTYAIDARHAAEQTGMSLLQRKYLEAQIAAEGARIRDREEVVRKLLFSVAPSPQALALVKQAEQISAELEAFQPIPERTQKVTETVTAKVDGQMVHLLGEIEQLPRISAQENQRALDGITDLDLLQSGGHNG